MEETIQYKPFKAKDKKGGSIMGRKVTRVSVQKDGSIKSEILRTEIQNKKSGRWETNQGGRMIDIEKI